LKRPLATLLCVLLGNLLPLVGHCQHAAAFSQNPEVKAFITDMHDRYGFDVSHLTQQFATIRPNAVVLRAIRPPAVPEKQRSWQRYRERFVNSQRIAGGISFWRRNAATLSAVACGCSSMKQCPPSTCTHCTLALPAAQRVTERRAKAKVSRPCSASTGCSMRASEDHSRRG